ncbi:DUF7017 domain-containing protein [Saccharicrinis sp. FJH2]|uniref:DUF7017 domain-containing protein n=1 Tax=Saccharicrinis sp. FJH65 TaxID=3344659 RepID=UPI0035F4BD62
MSIYQENSSNANEFRKAGKYDEAIQIYEAIRNDKMDKYIASGLLHCYRKKRYFDKAFNLIDETLEQFRDFSWFKNECAWTIISGELNKFSETPSTQYITEIALKILNLVPDQMAYKKAIFKVAKVAKENEDWEILDEWLHKIEPDQLKIKEEGKDWSESEIWHYYRAVYLIKTERFEEGILFINQVKDSFESKAKFFDRLVAKACVATNDLEGSEEIYEKLTKSNKVDWWILHEYAKVLLDSNKIKEALNLMYRASISPGPMKNKVSLFYDLANLLIIHDQPQIALIHYQLVHTIREQEGWFISTQLKENIQKLVESYPQDILVKSTRDILKQCKQIWNDELGIKMDSKKQTKTKNLKGKVNLADPNKPFCFIETKDHNSFFCSKDDLPQRTKNNQIVTFDLKQSFDKKKNKKSYKAVNIR